MRGSSRHGPSRPAYGGSGAGGRRPAGAAVDSAALAGLVEPVVAAAGMELETLRVGSAGRRLLVRVVVDADGGVALDDIADVSRELSAALDAGGALGEAPYTLEVSSPGVDRPLTEPKHWRRAVGRVVRSSAAAAPPPAGQPGQSRAVAVEGRVLAATDREVTIDVDGARRVYSYAELGPGRVQVEFGPAGRGGARPDGGEPDGH